MRFVSFKATCFTLVILIFALLCTSFIKDKTNENQQKVLKNLKKYNIESGIIEYSLTGFTKGTQTVYFDNWGIREATYSTTETNMMGITSKTNTLILIDGEWAYNINLDSKTGTKSKNLNYEDMLKYSLDNTIKDISEKTMQDMGGEKVGKEEILKKMCDVWQIKKISSKMWMWNGINMKNSTNMAGMNIDIVATKFQENGRIPSDKFKIPSDIKITDTPVLKN